MTNTQQTFEPTAMLQDAFSLRKIQMLILWPLMICLGLAPLLFSNSEYYGYFKALFWCLAASITFLHTQVFKIIGSIEISSKQMPETINKIDNKISKKRFIKILQKDRSIGALWIYLFTYNLLINKWFTGAVATADFKWDIGITPHALDLIATIQFFFISLIFTGILMFFFEMKSEPYYCATKKKRTNNIVAMMLILLCVVTSSRFDLVIDGTVPIETYSPTQWSIESLEHLFDLLLPLVVLSFFVKFLSFSQISYYVMLSGLIAKGENKKRIYSYTFKVSILSFLLAFFSYLIFDHVLLAIGFGILSVTLGVKWYYSIADNESKLVENCQSDLQIKYEKMSKENKLFLNRKRVLIHISIARYLDNDFSLLLFSSLLYGAMFSALIFL